MLTLKLSSWVQRESLESKNNANRFLIDSRILSLRGAINGNKDCIFNNSKDCKLEWARKLGVRQETDGMRERTTAGIREWVDQRLRKTSDSCNLYSR